MGEPDQENQGPFLCDIHVIVFYTRGLRQRKASLDDGRRLLHVRVVD